MFMLRAALLLFGFAVAATASPIEDLTSKPQNGTGWLVPQVDGTLKWMNIDDVAAFNAQDAKNDRASTIVEFYLYTQRNPETPQKITTDDASTLADSNFDSANPTRFIIHGWQNNYTTTVNVVLRSALLATGKNYNIFCVDWSSRAETINYPAAVLHVPDVGKLVANFVDFLSQRGGLRFHTLLVMGHSLGAHVAGFAGKNVKNGRIQQITGLDPAYPLYQYDKPADRLNENDALYVESIQTNAGLKGFLEPVGKGAFYPNGGSSQPGCGLDITGVCAHARSYEYYAEALQKNSFPSVKCGTYESALEAACGSTYSTVRMGSASNYMNVAGNFYVPVNRDAPYGLGK